MDGRIVDGWIKVNNASHLRDARPQSQSTLGTGRALRERDEQTTAIGGTPTQWLIHLYSQWINSDTMADHPYSQWISSDTMADPSLLKMDQLRHNG
ncbi:hypothetical protein RRG08_009944 [Elysia crispata]|uniref:Uncharacterized protein n=1 Tax=Elysia crispata TaxID=231223 RepID=A0AAE1E376_9GAST|nr:hypothetical protein RRG08_009944 [Elysia crispata]